MSRPKPPSHPPGETIEEQVQSTWRVLSEFLTRAATRETTAMLASSVMALNESVRKNTFATDRLVGLLAELLARSGEATVFRPEDLSGPEDRKT